MPIDEKTNKQSEFYNTYQKLLSQGVKFPDKISYFKKKQSDIERNES